MTIFNLVVRFIDYLSSLKINNDVIALGLQLKWVKSRGYRCLVWSKQILYGNYKY